MKIFLNAGHGGTDCGACSKNGTKEADITLKIVNLLAKKLKLNGYPYCIYQQKNSYFEISKEENSSGATLFISIHCNSATSSSAKGVEVLYRTESGKIRADIMQKELVKSTGLTNRGIKLRTDLHVLNRTKAPAILIELAFLSNENEEKMLRENPEKFVQGIWNAIKIYNKERLL